MAAGEIALISDLALVIVTAAVTALLFHKLRLPLVLGYLAAGVVVGPNVLPISLVRDAGNIDLLADLGILFLLFALGLDFHLDKLRRVGGLSLTAGLLEVSFMIGVGFLVGRLFGWSTTNAVFLGAILAISSTTIIVKVLSEQGKMRQPSTHAIFGILLVEDLVAVLLIALLSSIALTGVVTFASVGAVVVRLAIFVLATLVIGLVFVPRLVDHVARMRVEELLVLVAVGVAFATSMIAVALELSLALGAFIAGAVVAESRASATVERRIEPLRDMFAAVFFVATGILIDPLDVVAFLPAILVLSGVVIVGKVLAVTFGAFVAGYPADQAVRVGLGLAMIGEFSFVIAALGRDLGVVGDFLFPIAVSVSALTALVTPFLIRREDKVAAFLRRLVPPSAREVARMYSAWVSRSRPAATGEEGFRGGYDAGAMLRLLSYSATLVALALGTRFVDSYARRAFPDVPLTRVAVYAAFVLLSIPVLVGLVRALRKLVDQLVYVVIPPRFARTPRGETAAAVLRRTLYVFFAVIASAVTLAAGILFLPPLPLVAAAVVVVAIAGFLLRDALKRLNRQLEEAVRTVFKPGAAEGPRDAVVALIRERYPWDVHMEHLIVPEGSRAANRRIRDLQLPQRTGATIVSHERGGRQLVNPPPDTLILPGDALGVLGEREQAQEAARLLTSEAPFAERPGAHEGGVELEELDVREGSPLAGLTLAGSRIRETTGASVVGVRREGAPILNPAPVMRLQPGDSVLILGSPSQVAAARALFEPRP